jgi:hypothetical protein
MADGRQAAEWDRASFLIASFLNPYRGDAPQLRPADVNAYAIARHGPPPQPEIEVIRGDLSILGAVFGVKKSGK